MGIGPDEETLTQSKSEVVEKTVQIEESEEVGASDDPEALVETEEPVIVKEEVGAIARSVFKRRANPKVRPSSRSKQRPKSRQVKGKGVSPHRAPKKPSSSKVNPLKKGSQQFGKSFSSKAVPEKKEPSSDLLSVSKLETYSSSDKRPVPKMGSSDTIQESELTFAAIKGQKFFDIHKDLKKKKKLFFDPLFPPEKLTTIFPDNKYRGEEIEWLRPHQIVDNPEFVDGNSIQFDVKQGKLNDCWLMTAMSVVSMKRELFERVVPKGQRFVGDRYCGVFAFNFFVFGEWIQVCVDDLLPTSKGELIFSRSESKNEFWPALLEKAYAKISGGFDMLQYGLTIEGFQDITGGVCEKFKNIKDKKLFTLLQRYFLRKSLVSCYIWDKKSTELPCKLVTMHSYGLTGLKHIQIKDKTLYLLRLKNPWCRGEYEWNGAWSDNSPEWNDVPQAVRDRIGLVVDADGEFWMEFSDFMKYFNVFEICHLPLPKDVRAKMTYMWNVFQFTGQWSEELGTAGGNVGNRKTFHKNPKYLLTITSDDVEEDDKLCTVVFHLEQKLYRIRKSITNNNLAMGIIIYFYCALKPKDAGKENGVVELTPDSVEQKFFRYNLSYARTTYQETRIVCERVRFKLGHYIVIPTTFDPGVESHYMLRILIARSKLDKNSFKEENKPVKIEK